MLPGIKILVLKKNVDERGSFTEIMRRDWNEFLGGDKIVQSNFSITRPGVVRAWHMHERGQVDYFVVLKGAAKICAYDEKSEELAEVVSSEEKLQVVRIPGNYWHGFKSIGSEPAMIVYFTTRLYDYENPDEKRRPWNDKSVAPKKINGKADDPRCNKPWDWFYPPHR